jgi:hypothetical protein
MKENAETKTKRQEKLDFIRQQMPELIGNKNIHTDANLLLKAERLLFEGGYYKKQRYYEGRKASVLRLCVEAAQGERPKSNLVVREDRRK